jgi:hypothetical protein
MPRRLLLITYAFPPVQAPESYLSAKALSGLRAFDVDVFTIDPSRLGLPEDRSLDDFIGCHFKRIYRVNPPRWLGPKIFRWLRYLVAFPDRFRTLNAGMVKAALGLNIQHYDLIISWSQWHSIHLAAAEIKRQFPGIPWIVHMSDPWADNPFLPRIPGFSAMQRLMERKVIAHADAIHFTTNETLALVMRNYPAAWAEKAHVLPHTYATELYPEPVPARWDGRWVIRYLGNFYGPRNPRSLARALAELQKSQPSLLEGVAIELVGRWIDNAQWHPEDEGVQGSLLVFRKPVSYRESLRLMRDSDMLLILDAPFEVSVFFPSKLVDYIGAGCPILAFTPDGACADVLRKVGGMVFSPATIASIQRGLEVAIGQLKSGSAPRPTLSVAGQYDAICVGAQYDALLENLCKSHRVI